MKIQLAGIVAVALLAAAATASAQTQRSGSDTRAMQQVQQLAGERAALQSENAKLKDELDQARKDLVKATADKASLENKVRAGAADAGRDAASAKQSQAEVERLRAQLQELVTKFRETAQNLRDIEGDRVAARSELRTQERELKTCIDRNAGLYNLNTEVLDRMANRGFWSAVGEREPFTKLKRVELENLIDDYKYRADELRLEQQQAQTAKKN
jgi:DNA repair exonuclease SbcCD ATPase subunit